jgi:hypothetical protein
MSRERDPIADPQEGDWFVDPDGRAVRVDRVAGGEVYYATFLPHVDCARSLSRKTLEAWRVGCAESRVRYSPHGDPG